MVVGKERRGICKTDFKSSLGMIRSGRRQRQLNKEVSDD